jgi:hypothetical protein
MGREVVTEADVQIARQRIAAGGSLAAGAQAVPTKDEYGDRLMKYIPTEIVSLYLFVSGLLKSAGNQISQETAGWLEWGIFGFLLAMTFVYMRFVQEVKKKQQLIIVMISFAVWVFTLGGPFAHLGWYHPIYGALLLPLYTFMIATLKAKK